MRPDAHQRDVTTGRKDDHAKPDPLQVPPRAEWALWQVLTQGAARYGGTNWIDVERRRYMAAARRHLNLDAQGEAIDLESGLPHVIHAAANALFAAGHDLGDAQALRSRETTRTDGEAQQAEGGAESSS